MQVKLFDDRFISRSYFGNKIVNYIDISKEFNSIDSWNNKKYITNINFIDL